LKIRLRLSDFTKVVLGLVLGVVAGIIVGEPAGQLTVLGEAYIKLLQMTVLPYILVSLVGGLGALDRSMARRIGAWGGGLILFIWAVTMVTVCLLPLAYPDWTSASFFSTSLISEAAPFDPLKLYVPSNPFYSLSNTIVPAVVVFAIALGVAMIPVQGKDGLLRGLNAVSRGLMNIASAVARLAPYGIFVISAAAAGTLRLEELGRLQVFLWAYVAAWIVLTFFTLPAIVAWASPLSYRQVLKVARTPMLTAFAVGTVLVVLPMIVEKCQELIKEQGLESEEGDTAINVLAPTAYSFPSAGTLLGLGFIVFAAWFTGTALSPGQYVTFSLVGALSAFGTMAVALPFMLDFFRLPADLFQLYLLASVFTMRFATGLAAMHGVVICLLGATAIIGKLNRRRALEAAGVSVVIAGLTLVVLGVTLKHVIPFEYEGYRTFVSMELVGERVPTAQPESPPPLSAADRARPRLDVVRERGSLRVGYLPDRLPMAFRNDAGHIVGLDVELMNELARDLHVSLELVMFDRDEAVEWIESGRIDVMAGGLAITPEKASRLGMTEPYLHASLALIVPDFERRRFASAEALREEADLVLAVPQASYFQDIVQRMFPGARLVPTPSPRPYLRGDMAEANALVFSAEAGSAWTMVYPEYTVVVPKGISDMKAFLDAWLALKKSNGSIDRFYRHWILGEDAVVREPRWSVIKDVLHLVE